MAIFVWSDLHFNHAGIIRYCNRPFADVREMNESIIARWNMAIGPTDTIWVLGDFGFHGKDDLATIFTCLNGHKNLVIGNHDEKNAEVLKLPWERQERLYTLKTEGMRFELCHYPIEAWKGSHKGSIMLHGHSHGTLKNIIPHRFDVGFDVRPAPVNVAMLYIEAQGQVFVPQDHHGDL